ncbi:hypothetical protein KC360_g5429 [Hortaea werneckii]|nr:hypothetical protein KC325_g8823 [Hortaea werneckii]KAI6992301.1 hypothetical protein KC359_g5790 [Hortaea werneckii]KAI7144817.1 hypothetical protein KC344_g5026 [Hortaea werneckii]KAI7172604.1 hypothetical protein KC360_g5429 [Hortaea werneckii]
MIAVSLFLAIAVFVAFRCESSRRRLSHIPGPRLAAYTDIYRAYHTFRGNVQHLQRELHEQYGSAVRIGPNTVSLSSPHLIGTIYGSRSSWQKSDMYRVNDAYIGGQRISNVFNEQNEVRHAQRVKPIKNIYNMSRLVEKEPHIRQTLSLLMSKLERFSGGEACPMDRFIAFFAWDVIDQLTFGSKRGFLAEEQDIGNQIAASKSSLYYFAPICQIPWVDNLLDKNPIMRIGAKPLEVSILRAQEAVENRRAPSRTEKATTQEQLPPCFLDNFCEDEKVDDFQVVDWLLPNVLAGSDTTTWTLCEIMYCLAKNPENHRKLIAELNEAHLELPAHYEDVKDLPYLNAVLSEALRYVPGIPFNLERKVPAEGFNSDSDTFLPAGTVVGINPGVTGWNSEIFGDDADQWNANRWLQQANETKADWKARRSRMDKTVDFSFGGGSRKCLGSELSKLIILLTIATVYSRYHFALEDTKGPWQIHNAWFMYMGRMKMNISSR